LLRRHDSGWTVGILKSHPRVGAVKCSG